MKEAFETSENKKIWMVVFEEKRTAWNLIKARHGGGPLLGFDIINAVVIPFYCFVAHMDWRSILCFLNNEKFHPV